MDLDGQRLALLGFGVENRPLGAWLARHGFSFTVCDTNKRDTNKRDANPGVHEAIDDWRSGSDALSRLGDFDILFRSPGIPVRRPELVAARRAGVRLSSGIELFLDRCRLPVIGVTGTKGKGTTASLMLACVGAVRPSQRSPSG